MELTSPRRRTFSVNIHEVNWLPWSEWMTVPGVVGLELLALARASLTKTASQRRSMAQPTALREYRSSTTQQYSLPSVVGCSVMSVSHSWLGASAWNWRWTRSSHVGAFFRFL